MSEEQKRYQPSLFKSVEQKIENSTSTVEELRVPIYAPVKQLPPQSTAMKEFKKNNNVRTIETKWGQVEIRNRLLTQTHKDILDLIFTFHEKRKKLYDGSIALYFSQSKVAKEYGDTSKNLKWFRQKLDEITDCRIQYINNTGDQIDFRIINKKAFSVKEDMYGIILDENYVEFYEKGLSIDYEKKIPSLLKVGSPLVKSIIRFFFTHKSLNMSLEKLLNTIGFPLPASQRTMQTAKKTLRENIETFDNFEIKYDPKKEIFYYKGNQDVKIYGPVNTLRK